MFTTLTLVWAIVIGILLFLFGWSCGYLMGYRHINYYKPGPNPQQGRKLDRAFRGPSQSAPVRKKL